MADDNKAVGPLAAAKLVTLIKAETEKKYDKTGGKIDGSAEITGGLKVGMSSEFSSSIKAGSEISSDMLLMAPIVALHDPATEESISFGVSGENAAKVTSPVSGGGVQYARLAVGTPTGDNDAATKAYVDGLAAAGYEVITVTSTNVSNLGYDAEEGATKYTVFFDASFDSILANLAANKQMKFNITIPDNDGDIPISFNTGYVSALGNALYLFTGTLAGAPIALSINALGSATIYMYGDYLPEPNPDDSDDGKFLMVNKHKWEMKKPKEDFVVTITPLSPSAVPTSVDGGIAQFTASCDKTFAEIKGAIDAGKNVLGNYNGNIWPLTRATDTMMAFDGTINLGYFGDTSNATCSFVIQSNGIATINCAAGELPAVSNNVFNKVLVANNGHWDLTDTLPSPNSDGTDTGKVLTVYGTRWEMKKHVVDYALSDTSTNPVQNKVVTKALNGKASTAVASQTANGLMSKDDKKKLDGIEEGATRVIVDDSISSTSTNPVQNKVVKKYIDDHNFLPDPIPNGNAVQTLVVDRASKTYKLMTFDNLELPSAAESTNAPQTRSVKYLLDRKASKDAATKESDGLMSALDKTKLDNIEDGANKTVVDEALDDNSANPVQNKAVKAALDTKAGTAVANALANGLMSKDDKAKLDGVESGANKTIVDETLDAASENPVQNRAVKAALDGKLSTLGGEISGHLEVGQTVSAEGSVSVGRTSADTGIHFEKAASDAGRISHGSDPMTGVAPIARLKVADPTEDDDAATKKYVDDRAVRHDAAQGLTPDQKFVACANIGAVNEKRAWVEGEVVLLPRGADGAYTINITPIENSNDYMLALDGGPENVPVYVSGLETPTDAQTDCAANVAYVKAKIAEVAASGGVDVDNALSATSTNPVQNKVITSALNGKADKSELGNKADKTALDAKADKTALDAKMDKSGGTFTGNVYGKYFCGTWLQSTAASDLGRAPGKIAVLDDSGWVYYRTPAELLADIGAMSGGDYYTKSETDAAIAVRASTSAYGTTKLSNSTTSSSKTLAATPYAVKTALAQAKAYVDSAVAVAINSAY